MLNSIAVYFVLCTVLVVHTGGECLRWWTSGVVNVWGGERLRWWTSGVVNVWFLPRGWWTSEVVNVWGGECLGRWWTSYNRCSYACSYYNVHQCLQQPTKDVLRQNDRYLADIQPPPSLHWSSGPFLHGHPQVPSLILPFYVWRSMSKVQNRNDDDREVNHHGRTIEVGEADREEKGKYRLLFKA